MLFKPDGDATTPQNESRDASRITRVAHGAQRRTVSIALTLIILGGLGYVGWNAWQQKQTATRAAGARPDAPVPVLAATPRVQDVPVYLDGVGAVKALNTVTVRAQVDGKLLSINFKDGQDVKAGDVLAEIDPAIYKANFDQAVAKKAQDEATLANARIDLTRYQQLALTNAGSKQQSDTQKATVAQLEALVRSDQAAIDNAEATLSYTKVIAPLSGRAGLRQVDQGNIIRSSDANGIVVITQLQPIAVQFSLPQQQIVRVNGASAKGPLGVDVFGNDATTVADSGSLVGIDNQVDVTTGTVKLKAQFDNTRLQLWPGQFVNVRLKVETLPQAIVVPTSAVQRGPAGTFAYVIGEGNVVSARPVTVTQQNESDAVIAKGIVVTDRVVTTGFANLADGARVQIGDAAQTPSADLAPRKKQGGKGEGKGGDGQGGERRGKRDAAQSSPEGDQKGSTGPAPAATKSTP